MPERIVLLKDRREVAEGTLSFWFDTAGLDFNFKAGQFVALTLHDPPETDGKGHSRDFTIASSPHDTDTIMITARMRNTAFKRNLQNVPLGTKVEVRGPMGGFVLHKDAAKPAVFLAGGIGVTPFRSMIEWVTREDLSYRMYLFYSNRIKAQTTYLEEFTTFAAGNSKFTFVPTLTQSEEAVPWPYESGKINQTMLRRHIHQNDFASAIYYSAGPPGMVAAMRELLEDLGIDEMQIKTEEFSGY